MLAPCVGLPVPRGQLVETRFRSMSLRTRLLLLLGIVTAAVFVMAGMVYLTIRSTDFYRQRIEFAHGQLAAMVELAKSANHYSEQITQVLLLGEEEWPDFVDARDEVEAGFAELERATRAEVAFLEDRRQAEVVQETEEFEQIAVLRRLYSEIDRSVEQVILLQDSGRRADALVIFRANIERRLDAEFERLLAAGVAGERQEVAEAQAAAADLARRLTVALVLTAVTSLAVSVLAALLLSRALSGSIGRLMEGAAAIGRGDLGHRIPVTGGDELAVLSRRFNEMADQIEDQQRRLMLVQRDLESQVSARTGELEQANARLQHLDQSRVRFLADISHELRTPLTIVRGEAEVMLRGAAKDEDEYRDTLQRIVLEAAQMSRLVDDLLFLARSQSDTIGLETRPVILQDVLAEVLAAGDAMTGPNRIRLERHWPDAPIRVDADPQRLKQAVVILVDNAIKYSDNADTVRIAAEEADQYAEISVTDHGSGIRPEDLPFVFERFYRGGAGVGNGLGGSGLGLPIARWIAEKHGGTISVTSEPHQRTEFRIRLPLGPAQ
jgi:signal transduction histidine kinase